jgi:outer membrane protein
VRPDLDRSSGGGLAVTGFFSDAIAAEVGISRTTSNLGTGSFALGTLRMTPVTATMQYHFTPRSFADFYVGGGAAYAFFGPIRNGRDLPLFDISSIEFEDDFGWLVNAGTNFRIRDRWGLNLDAKYMRFNVSTSARLTDGSRTDKTSIRLSPLTVAAGISYRF